MQGYYSIDDIETNSVRVPCKFLLEVPNLGFLLPERNTPGALPARANVYSGAETLLPLWLAAPLASAAVESAAGDVPVLEMQEPEMLSVDVLNVLRAEPLALDLRSQSRLFIFFALVWNSLFTGDELATVLYDAVRIRAAAILDAALAQSGASQQLDEYEVQMYNATAKGIKDVQQWIHK